MDFRTSILMAGFVTHDVKQFIVEWPDGLGYEAGQGVEVFIDQEGWRDKGRPFTPTSTRDSKVLEFTIKRYPEHKGMTDALHDLKPGDGLLLSESFGTITYQGPGTFIAGGAGITPFLAILRQLAEEDKLPGNRLIFSNKTPADVICEKELRHYFGQDCLLTCTRSSAPGYDSRRIDRDYLQENIEDFDQHFYVCGPSKFVKEINRALKELGAKADALVFEH